MITYDLSARGRTSLYAFLYERIRDDIIAGTLAAGAKLPSKRALAQNLGVGVNTIALAYGQLVAEGFVQAQEKRGYFVADVRDIAPVSSHRPERLPVEEDEPGCVMDFRANRLNLDSFPIDLWNRCMRKAMLDGGTRLYQTVPYAGLPELRNAIAEYLHRSRGMHVSPACIVIGAGTEYLLMRLFALFGDNVGFGIESTGFKKLILGASRFHARAVIVPPKPSDDLFDIGDDLDMDRLRGTDARLMYVSPANRFPTGRVMPASTRSDVLRWAYEKPGRYVVEDDYDSEFRYAGRLTLPLFAEDGRDRVIYLNTFSKTMVPSLRIGYMVLPPELMDAYRDQQGFYSCTVSSFEQFALAEFIDSSAFERHMNRMRNFYRKKRKALLKALRESPLARRSTIEEYAAGTHFLLRVRTDLKRTDITQKGEQLGLRISFFTDYSICDIDMPGQVTLVVNYAAIDPGRIDDVVDRLCQVFEL